MNHVYPIASIDDEISQTHQIDEHDEMRRGTGRMTQRTGPEKSNQNDARVVS
jgi:hypothetical protein